MSLGFVCVGVVCFEDVIIFGSKMDITLWEWILVENVFGASVMTGYGFEKWESGVCDGGRNGFGDEGIAVIGIGDCFSWGKDCCNKDEDGDGDEGNGKDFWWKEWRIHGWNEWWLIVDYALSYSHIVWLIGQWIVGSGSNWHLPRKKLHWILI